MQSLFQGQFLLQKLTPQQVQYLKMLQLPLMALEQRIKEELEMNPLLEEGEEMEQQEAQEPVEEKVAEEKELGQEDGPAPEDRYSFEDFMNDELSGYKTTCAAQDGEEKEEMPLPDMISLSQRLMDQIRLLNLNPDEEMLAEEIIGNVDEDGYLRRDLGLIVQDLTLERGLSITGEMAEHILHRLQHLDPPGIAARNLQECLIAQIETGDYSIRLKHFALEILKKHWNLFSMKHYEDLCKEMGITMDTLREIFDFIQKLNPKPGEGEFSSQQNYITPDFIVERDGEDFIVQLNERNVPPLRINKAYRDLMTKRKAASNGSGAEVKEFIRKQFDAAKWFISSIHQRRDTMLRVMRTIVDLQQEFFTTGENLKPMIYRDIAEVISMDISTISRVVNGKYVQTEYGVFELRYFFSDSITTSSGDEVSNKVVKKKIKDMIDAEDAAHPLSDDKLADVLRADGLNIARRTVAKYREAMKIPVARLRRKL